MFETIADGCCICIGGHWSSLQLEAHPSTLGRWGVGAQAMASFNAFVWIGRAAGLRLPELRSRQAVDALVLVGQAEE